MAVQGASWAIRGLAVGWDAAAAAWVVEGLVVVRASAGGCLKWTIPDCSAIAPTLSQPARASVTQPRARGAMRWPASQRNIMRPAKQPARPMRVKAKRQKP